MALRLARSRSVSRAVAILSARAGGATQAEVARELGITVRSVRRYEAAARRGALPPIDAARQAAFAEYRAARTASARATLLAALVHAAAIEARWQAASRELEALRLAGGGSAQVVTT